MVVEVGLFRVCDCEFVVVVCCLVNGGVGVLVVVVEFVVEDGDVGIEDGGVELSEEVGGVF